MGYKKKYKYVVVAGCSFSAAGEPPNHHNLVKPGETYGSLISDYFGSKFYDLSKPGGSNFRSNRKILEWCSENKDKFEDVLILVPMTEPHRFEVYNNATNTIMRANRWFQGFVFAQREDKNTKTNWLDTITKDIFDIHSKLFLIPWSTTQRKNYFINFYNENYCFYQNIDIVIGLQSFLKLNNVDHIFFDTMGSLHASSLDTYWKGICDEKNDKYGFKRMFDNLVSHENWYRHPEHESMFDLCYWKPEMRMKDNPAGKDHHPSKEGHKYWANCLIDFLESKV